MAELLPPPPVEALSRRLAAEPAIRIQLRPPTEYREPRLGAMRPEHQLLVSCARTRIDGRRTERIRSLLQGEISWPYLIEAAEAHRITPLLYRALRASSPEAVPEPVLERLQSLSYANAIRSAVQAAELIKLLGQLRGAGIPAIPIKGPVLAAMAYGDLSLRQSRDLDIVVHPTDVVKATHLLTSRGYQPLATLSTWQTAARLRYQHACGFVAAKGGAVELHWSVTPIAFSFPLDLEPYWQRTQPVPMCGTTVESFSPEDTLLMLCVHAARHTWRALGWISDIAELIDATAEMDWERTLERSNAHRGELYVGLQLAGDLLGARVPDEVRKRVADDPAACSLAARFQQLLFSRGPDHRLSTFERFRLTMQARGSLLHKAQYALRFVDFVVAPNTNDFAALQLPRRLSFLYYLVRPMRLVRLIR